MPPRRRSICSSCLRSSKDKHASTLNAQPSTTPMSLHTLTIAELRDKLRRGEVSAFEVTQSVLDRIAAVDGKLKAYLWLNADDALAQADAIDRAGIAKDGRLLGGIPV